MHRKILSFLLLSLCLASSAAPALQALPMVFIERFDQTTAGTLLDQAAISPGSGMEKGALLSVMGRQRHTDAYRIAFAAQPGKRFAFGLNYRNSKIRVSNAMQVRVDFLNTAGKTVQSPCLFRYSSSVGAYNHAMGEFAIPDGAVGFQLTLQGLLPAGEKLWYDNLRIERIGENGRSRYVHLEHFETTFDRWELNYHLIFERFCMGRGGRIVNEWKEAKIGEAFFECRGSMEPMQYSLMIRNLNVKPSHNYLFEGYYKATDNFKFNGHGILIFFQKDKNGRPVGQTRFHIRNTGNEWKSITHALTTGPNCAFIDIGLNTRKMTDQEFVRLDHLRFKEGSGDLSFSFEINPGTRIMKCTALPMGFNQTRSRPEIAVVLQNEQKKEIFRKQIAPEKEEQIDLNAIADGYYFLSAEMTLNQKKYASRAQKIAVCKNPSWSNNIGIGNPAEPPPIPWKALAYPDKNTVRTWNNSFRFSTSPLPDAISAVQSSRPSFTLNGEPVSLRPPLKWRQQPSQASAEFTAAGKDWAGKGAVSVDYTGFYRFAMDIKPTASELKLTSAKLSWTLDAMDFLYRSDDSWTAIGAVDLKKNPHWNSRHFYNEMQFGTETSGLVWYAPKLYPAVANFNSSWILVNRLNRSVAIETVNAPLTLQSGQSHRLEFALAPYPFRPAKNYWQTIRYRAGKMSNLDLVWQNSSLFKYCGSTAEAADPQGLQRLISSAHQQGRQVLFYQFPFYIMDSIPEWSYFRKHWKANPSRAYDMGKTGMGVKGDIRRRTWQDFYLNIFRKHLQDYSWDGVYYDCFGTDLFTENGEEFHPTFETRAFQERIYRAQREKNPASLTITHLGGAQFNTAAAFSDIVLMGEQYRAPFSSHDFFTEFLSLDEFRYENTVRLGPDRMLLPQYRSQHQIDSPRHCTHVMGMALLHNLMIYPNFIHKQTELNIRYRLYDFGLADCTFHGYWTDEEKLLLPSRSQVKISYYQNKKGIFAVIFNPTRKAVPFRFLADARLRNGTVYNSENNQESTDSLNRPFTLQPHMALFAQFGF